MKNRINSLLTALAMFASFCGVANATTIEFRGSISAIEQASDVFHIGDSVVLSYTLAEPLANTSSVLPDSIFTYASASNFLSVGSTVYNFSQPAPFLSEYNYFGQYGPNFGAGLQTDVTEAINLSLYSTHNVVTSADGLLLPGFAISDFDEAFGRLISSTHGIAFWNITSYSVTGAQSVPESTSTALLLATGLFTLIAVRRRCLV